MIFDTRLSTAPTIIKNARSRFRYQQHCSSLRTGNACAPHEKNALLVLPESIPFSSGSKFPPLNTSRRRRQEGPALFLKAATIRLCSTPSISNLRLGDHGVILARKPDSLPFAPRVASIWGAKAGELHRFGALSPPLDEFAYCGKSTPGRLTTRVSRPLYRPFQAIMTSI